MIIETTDAQELFEKSLNLIKSNGNKEEIGKHLLQALAFDNGLIGKSHSWRLFQQYSRNL